jgi:hypothetical protein
MASEEEPIDDAITAYVRQQGWSGIVTGWVVLVATADFDGNQDKSGVSTIYPGGSMPWIQALGILEAARIRMHRGYAEGDS